MGLKQNLIINVKTNIETNSENNDELYPASIERTGLNDIGTYNIINHRLIQHK